MQSRTASPVAPARAKLSTDRERRLHGQYNAARLTCSTAEDQLSGTKSQFMLAYVVTISPEEVELRPVVIAHRRIRPLPDIADWSPIDPMHVWPGAIDQFTGIDFNEPPMKQSELKVLKAISEQAVKTAFAEILGEPEVPKDWGGEQFDLWTAGLTVNGQPLRAAFAFKGPAAFHPMTIADLGKNGDQVERLAQTAADVLVVQHCHSIRAPVIRMLQAFANDQRYSRRYMTIDGYATIRILRHFGKLR